MAEVFNQTQENNAVDRSLIPLPQPHLTGMKLKGDISLGDFLFNTIDEYGVVWVITDIEGWWQHPEPDMPDIPRGFGDGSYDIKGRYEARILTLSGSFMTPDPSLVEAARDRLISATDLVYKGAWLKTGVENGNRRASFVRLSGGPEIQTITARGRTDFSIGLKAADPIKYNWNDADPDGYEIVEILGKNRETGDTGLRTINNVGNTSVPIEFEVQGPISGPARIYNRTTDKLLYIVSNLRGRITSRVVNKQLSFNESTLEDVAVLTTTTPHGLLIGDLVTVSGVGDPFDGDFEVTSTATETTFTYTTDPQALVSAITTKKLQSAVATITTQSPHGFVPNNSVIIKDVDAVFDGTHTIISTPSDTSFTFSKNRVPPKSVSGSILVSNIATLTTTEPHQFIEGENVTISNINTNYDGTYEIASIPSPTTFSYALSRTNRRSATSRSMTQDVATITMSAPHGFITNENVAISGINSTFDGVYSITSTPTSTTFTYNIARITERAVSIRSRFSNIATLTMSEPHGLFLGEEVLVKDVGSGYDGASRVIIQTPSNTTLAFSNSGANETALAVTSGNIIPTKRFVSARQLIGGVVTLFTAGNHGYLEGESVTVTGLGSPFNGTFTILSVPSTNSFTYSVNSANVAYTFGVGIINRNRVGTLTTITTETAHNLSSNQYVLISGMDSAAAILNGNYIINVTSPTTFTYNTSSSGDIEAAVTSANNVKVVGGFSSISRNIASASSTGSVTVGGSLPFTAVNGFAQVSPDILSSSGGALESAGVSIKTANIPFTPGIIGGSVDFGPDILEINTLTRDVALNGSFDNARAKLDVLTEFFFLEPGENEIEFLDERNTVSTSLLKLFYRSGWLG
jgi:hypothetical protein